MLLLNASQIKSRLFSWGHWFTMTNVFIGLLVSVIYLFAQPLPTEPLAVIYLLTYWLGHIAFLFFISYILLVFPLSFLVEKPGLVRLWASLVHTTLMSLLFLDALVFSAYGYHLDLLTPAHIRSDVSLLLNDIPSGWWAAIGLLSATILAILLVMGNTLWRRLDEFRALLLKGKFAQILLVCFFSSHIMHIWADAKLYTPITKSDNLLPLSYPMTAKTLLAQSGLIKLDEYESKRELQFEVANYQIDTPDPSFRCVSPFDPIQIDVLQIEDDSFDLISAYLKQQLPRASVAAHWAPTRDQNVVFELLHGFPAIYQQSNTALPTKLRDALSKVSGSATFNLLSRSEYINSFDLLKGQNSDATFHFNLVNINQKTDLDFLTERRNQTARLIVLLPQNTNAFGQLFVIGELVELPKTTSNYDILPTLLEGWLSCSFPSDYARFGQNLFSIPVNQPWLVSADNHTVYIKGPKYNYQINDKAQIQTFDSDGNALPDVTADKALIARAINQLKKHLQEK